MEGYFMAQVMWFGGTFAPINWFDCNGSSLSIEDYTALYSLIGTTYGGDGQFTFNVPDFRGRIPVGVGQGPGLSPVVLGEMAGSENRTLTVANMPMHNHGIQTAQVNAANGTANSNNPAGNVFAATTTEFYHNPTGATGKLKTVSATVSNAGQGQSFPTTMPSMGLRVVICVFGIYPIRN